MPYKKCPGCEEKDILIQDEICYICRLKITRFDRFDEITSQQFSKKEKKLFIALKQIIEQFNSYIIYRKDYAKDLLKANIWRHLDLPINCDEETFRYEYPLLFKMFPGEYYFWIELRWNFLEALEVIGTKRDGWDKVVLLNHKLAIEEYDNKKLKENMEKKLREKTEELEIKLENERIIHMDAMKTMDSWYLQRNLELVKENKQKDQKIKELEQQLKSLKLEVKTQTSPVQTLTNWQNIHPSFTEELVNQWQSFSFTCQQVQDWINIHSPTDQFQAIQEPEFYAWLRDIKNLTVEQVLNSNNIDFNDLKLEFQQSQQQVLQVQQTIICNKTK